MSRLDTSDRVGLNVLEHRVPPPVVMGLLAIGMWLVAGLGPVTEIGHTLRFGATAAFGTLAAVFGILGFRAFGRARTTINPVQIDQASTLVTTGVYAWTRNPMYVGLTLLLCAWAAVLGTPWTLAGPLVFAAFITRFQIVPEERALHRRFGSAFDQYRRQVRRWI